MKLSLTDKQKKFIIETTTLSSQDSIFSVIGRMEVLLEFFRRHVEYHYLIPFLETYYFVTKRVAEKSLEKISLYHNYTDIEKLDVYFASLYFQPLQEYLLSNQKLTPWLNYYNYISSGGHIPFLQVLLGINSHINKDLLKTIVDLDYNHKKDFEVVNTILEEVIPELVNYLVWIEHDIFALTGIFMKQFFLDEFKGVIVKWRTNAWENSRKIDKDNKEGMLMAAEQKTELLAQELIDIFNFNNIRNPDFVVHALERINNLEVKL